MVLNNLQTVHFRHGSDSDLNGVERMLECQTLRRVLWGTSLEGLPSQTRDQSLRTIASC